jgi:hypothetical protein
MQSKSGHVLKAIRTDRGTEFINCTVTAYLESIGADHQPVPPETKQQNGTAERFNKTIVQKARCIRIDAGLPLRFWPECVRTACILHNVTANTVTNATPAQAFLARPICLAPLRIPGCLAYVFVPKAQRGHKFAPCSRPAVMLGYEPNTKGYRLLVRVHNTYKVMVSRDVIFDEHIRGYPVLQDPATERENSQTPGRGEL